MNPYSGKIKTYFYTALILSLISSALYCICFFTVFDTDIGYFASDAVLPYIAKAILFSSTVWLCSAFIFIPKSTIPNEAPAYRLFSRISAVCCAAAFIVYAALRILSVDTTIIVSYPLYIVCTLLALISTVYFIQIATGNKAGENTRLVLGFFPIFWAALSMTEAYTNKFVAMNSPLKVLLMLSMMSIMLFMLYELRYQAKRPFPRTFLVVSTIGICLIGAFSLPFLISTVTGIYTIGSFFPTAVVSLIFMVYIVSRLTDMICALANHANTPIDTVDKADNT